MPRGRCAPPPERGRVARLRQGYGGLAHSPAEALAKAGRGGVNTSDSPQYRHGIGPGTRCPDACNARGRRDGARANLASLRVQARDASRNRRRSVGVAARLPRATSDVEDIGLKCHSTVEAGTQPVEKTYRLMLRQSTRPWTPEEDAQLLDCAARGWSPLKISLRVRRSIASVRKRALALQVILKEPARLPSKERIGPVLR
jgi:hypothetical protein